MPALTADDIKNILYILPVFSALICAVYVRYLNRASEAEASAKPDWQSVNLLTGKGGGAAGGGAAAIQLMSEPDDEMQNVRHIGLVIEYNDTALLAHAKNGKFAGTATQIKKAISDIFTRNGLLAARTGLKGKEQARSQIMFNGSIEKFKKAVWQLREEMGWLRSLKQMDDVAIAFTVQQTGRGLKARIKFEPCPILFNQEFY